jgi:hypothetical protein
MGALAFGALLACMESRGKTAKLKWAFVPMFALSAPVLAALWTHVTGDALSWVQIVKYAKGR